MIAWGGVSPYATRLDTGGIYCASNCTTATYFADADGDGHGDPSAPLQSCTQPPGYVADGSDCNDANPDAWATPSEARDLVLLDPSSLQWAPPTAPGGLDLAYDLLKSGTPADFMTAAACVASDSTGTSATDPEMPLRGRSFFYLVRAANTCPGGQGVLGTNSTGQPIAGRACP